MMWPEFEDKSDIKNRTGREEFNCFRRFLEEWASEDGDWTRSGGTRIPISSSYERFNKRPDSRRHPLPLPMGFDFDLAFPRLRPVVLSRPQLQLTPSRVSDSLTSPAHGTSTSLARSSNQPTSSIPDESHPRGLESSGVGTSQEMKKVRNPIRYLFPLR
jgi:hypothetical protein